MRHRSYRLHGVFNFGRLSHACSEGIGSMSVPRAAPAAASLPDGVLVAGGYYGYDFLGRGCPTTFVGDAARCAEIFRLGVPPASPATCSPPAPAPSATSATCRGKQATIVGTEGNDVREGTSAKDVIAGLGGNDKLSGLAGNDLICGGAGKDILKGGKGNDKLYGEAGKDTLKAGPGKDILKAALARTSRSSSGQPKVVLSMQSDTLCASTV